MKTLTIGRIVLFTMTAALAISIADERARSDGRLTGNSLKEGDIVPLLITRVWDEQAGTINGQLLLDGNHSRWVTSIPCSAFTSAPGSWHWPDILPGQNVTGAVQMEPAPLTSPGDCGKGLAFGGAVKALKAGCRVCRAGWNGKGMFVYLVPAASYPAQTGAAKAHFGESSLDPYNAYLALKGVDDTVSTWAPSGSDALAEDWEILPG